MTTPKPCPWCGCSPTVVPTNPEYQGNAWGRVFCANVECPATPSVGDGVAASDGRGSDAYKELAIERWNRRERRMRIKFNRACRATCLLRMVLSPDGGFDWRRRRATSDNMRGNVAVWMGRRWTTWLLRRDPNVFTRLTGMP